MSAEACGIVLAKDLLVAMRDGVCLATDVYRPSSAGEPLAGAFPTILCRTPYDKTDRRYGEIADLFTPRGYVTVLQDLRGRCRSEGVGQYSNLPPRPAWRMRFLLWLLPLTTASLSPAADSVDFSAPADTVEALWSNYDPGAEPLEIETKKTWDENGLRIEQLRFTGETRQEQDVRVFAYRSVPAGSADTPVPGIVHIHGGGQTASLDWVRFWGNRGYACVSFDFCGKHPARPAEMCTDWGPIDANMLSPVAPPTNVQPAPRHSAWFHWALLSRRAITLLEQHPRVDGGRLGVFGISVGGTLTWLVAGVDSRVKAAAPIYGVGQNSYTFPWEKPEELTDPQRRKFRDLLEPESYAPHIACPLLWLNSSNDHHGRLDSGMRTLALTAAGILRQAYTPRFMHHIAPAEAADLPLWMDWHLKGQGDSWPKSPELEFHVQPEGQLAAKVTVDRPHDVAEIACHWGLNNPWPVSRFYRVARSEPGEPHRQVAWFPLEVSSAADTVYAFANVTYRSGVVLSSRLAAFAAAGQGIHPRIQRTTLIDSMETDQAWYWLAAPTDPCNLPVLFDAWKGANGERGFVTPQPVFQFATNLLSDPQWHGRGRQTLQIDALTDALPAELEIEVAERFFQPGGRSFKARIELTAGPSRWTTISLWPEQFIEPAGKSLTSWDEVDYLLLRGKHGERGPTVFRNLRWHGLEE